MTYSWELMHLMRRVASGEESPEAIKAMYKKDFERYPKGYYKMNIITNHDENSWNGTAEEFFGEGQEAWFVFAATTYGMPLVYSGQEANNTKRLEFFEKDSIDWSRGYVFSNLYKTLFQLKEDNPALWNGEFGGSLEWIETSANESVLAYRRKKGEHEVVVFINIQGQPITLTFEEELGAMRNVMDNIETVVSGELSLPPNGFKVFAK